MPKTHVGKFPLAQIPEDEVSGTLEPRVLRYVQGVKAWMVSDECSVATNDSYGYALAEPSGQSDLSKVNCWRVLGNDNSWQTQMGVWARRYVCVRACVREF